MASLGSIKLTALSRKIIILVCAISVVFLLTQRHLTDLWDTRQSTHTTPDATQSFQKGLERQSPNDEWGLQGQKTAQLIEWGNHLITHPSANKLDFLNALLRIFPFLGGSLEKIDTPWTGWTSPSKVGIVMSVGSGNYHLACHLIGSLRNVLDSQVPIAITYAGDKDLKPEERDIIGTMGDKISFIDLLKTFPGAEKDLVDSGWASKPFAMLATPFPKTILVDADAIFLKNPDDLFDSNPDLHRTGALFYHDRASWVVDTNKQDFVQKQLDSINKNASEFLTSNSLFWQRKAYYEADSGLVAMDKGRVGTFLGLIFATWMNTKAIRDEYTHKIFYGDKESYWIAMELCGAPYSFPPWYAGSMGKAEWSAEAGGISENTFQDGDAVKMCGKHMLHVDHTGTQPFWFNGGIYEDKGDPKNGYATLTHWWMQADKHLKEAPGWSWMNGNWACLKEKGVHKVNDHDHHVLQQIFAEVEKIDKRLSQAKGS
ncbi:glycosyltransferase family 71 protein [Myriangium duriaei CBS 260.36]|uniref:Glycosyltransferase family 71 protein n=1 Tax=Myriangium duriaei CBS 260.36 TaxID=1168546 RepID=A0A9P4MCF5_9PEZI|nr:glycosyltransferase family 71 protein [Myriangium duriaei CBS 260.36]